MYRTILITGANGDVADAIARVLRERYPAARLVGADAAGEWPGRILFPEFHRLPFAMEGGYPAALAELAVRTQADLIIPTNDHELRVIAEHSGELRHLPILVNPPDVVRTFLDKLETVRWLAGIGVPAPRTTLLCDAQNDELPIVAKPRCSSGSRGVRTLYTSDELAQAKRSLSNDFIAQELLGTAADEFTCAMVRPASDLLMLVMRRKLFGGITSEIQVEDQPEIERMLRRIAGGLPAFMALNVQLRLTANGPRIFEINPRFSSTTMIRHRVGFEDLAWVCDARIARAIPRRYCPPVGTRVFRRFTEVVVAP